MRRQTALPRISREGWVPAGPDKRVNKRAMLIPKTGDVSGLASDFSTGTTSTQGSPPPLASLGALRWPSIATALTTPRQQRPHR